MNSMKVNQMNPNCFLNQNPIEQEEVVVSPGTNGQRDLKANGQMAREIPAFEAEPQASEIEEHHEV
jgi:hypothetical protein